MEACARSSTFLIVAFTNLNPYRHNQLRRPEGYEDCIAVKLIEKVGERDTLRDAIAMMYFGPYRSCSKLIETF